MNQDKPKGMIEEAQQTGSFLIGLFHAGAIPLRLVSRVPGSMGAGYMFPGVLWGYGCLGVASAILMPNLPHIYLYYYFQVTGWWWLVHVFMYFASHRKGNGTYSHHTGIGWINKLFPSNDLALFAFLSDAVAAVGLAVLFVNYGDKGTAGLMMLSLFFSFVSTALLDARDKARGRAFHSAIQQQKYYEEIMQKSLNSEDME